MNKVLIAAIATVGFATSALAFDDGVDADGDGVLSVSEMVAAYPDITEAIFIQVDTDEDGVVSEEELAAAKESGLLAM